MTPVSFPWQVGPADPEDIPEIEDLVASVGGDTEQLEAEQFVVAKDVNQRVIGAARLKPYDGFCELASLAVRDEWRTGGVGRAVVSQLLEAHQGPVYLICEDHVVNFFRRFGFDLIPMSEMLHRDWSSAGEADHRLVNWEARVGIDDFDSRFRQSQNYIKHYGFGTRSYNYMGPFGVDSSDFPAVTGNGRS